MKKYIEWTRRSLQRSYPQKLPKRERELKLKGYDLFPELTPLSMIGKTTAEEPETEKGKIGNPPLNRLRTGFKSS